MSAAARRTLLSLCLLGLPACYDFPSPIDATPQNPLDAGLLGTWRCLPDDSATDVPATLTVSTARDRVYAMRLDIKDEKEPGRYEAHISRVSGSALLNVRNLDEKAAKEPWHYVRYTLPRPYALILDLVDDDVLTGVTAEPGSARKGLERLSANPKLYSGFLVCVKAKPEVERSEDSSDGSDR